MTQRTLLRSTFMLAVLFAFLSTSLGAAGAQSITAERTPASMGTVSGHNALSLSFVANIGQIDPSVLFEARADNKTMWFASNSVTLNLPVILGPDQMVSCANPNMQMSAASPIETQSMLRLTFDNANPNLALQGTNQFPRMANLFTDGNPLAWRANEPIYGGVVYRALYPGVDLSFAGQDGKLTATYNLAAGADPSLVGWHYLGADSLYTNISTGDLHIYTPDGALLISSSPSAWQLRSDGVQIPVSIGYQTAPDNMVRFGMPLQAYDPTLPLIITLKLE